MTENPKDQTAQNGQGGQQKQSNRSNQGTTKKMVTGHHLHSRMKEGMNQLTNNRGMKKSMMIVSISMIIRTLQESLLSKIARILRIKIKAKSKIVAAKIELRVARKKIKMAKGDCNLSQLKMGLNRNRTPFLILFNL